VPHRHDPDGVAGNPVEEPVWPNNDLAILQVRELRDPPAGFGKALEATELLLRLLSEGPRGSGFVATDEGNCVEKLATT